MGNKTLEESKDWLDKYIGLESEIYNIWGSEKRRTLIYRVRKDKPILLKSRISDYGNGWELGAVEHTFQLEETSKMMRDK